jgi:eukaryotic-like serine/threonine-protein kinase
MTDPRLPESAIRSAVSSIDELDFIDGGGQSDAWRLRRNGGGDEVLKVIISADPVRVAREIATMQAITNPHVMGFTESGELTHGGTTYSFIIGEYVSGRSLASRIEADEWPDEKEALAAMIGTLQGLAAIHAEQVVHRDVKPGNIALRASDWRQPVVLDLGYVRDMLGTSITVYPNRVGTVPYMAPEQLRKERAVRRSDVFSAGVTLFQLASKEHPFLDVNENIAIEVFEERIRDSDWPKWDDVQSIADEVKEVLAHMLKPNAYERPRADAAADVLQTILDSR